MIPVSCRLPSFQGLTTLDAEGRRGKWVLEAALAASDGAPEPWSSN